MNWDNFYIFGILSIINFLISIFFVIKNKNDERIIKSAVIFSFIGIFIFLLFIIGFWIYMERPPLRTMGETRLWFSFFLSIIGITTYILWKNKIGLVFANILSSIFIIINIFNVEIHYKTLMPALQSIFFIPHVAIYMLAYAMLSVAFILSIFSILKNEKEKKGYLNLIDNYVYVGTALLTIGMLLGALWAKEAWGDYWNWDIKESWALITWFLFLCYIHYRLYKNHKHKIAVIIVIFAFVALQMCWYGVNYLPHSENSIHLYNSDN